MYFFLAILGNLPILHICRINTTYFLRKMVYLRNRISKVKNGGNLEYLRYFFTQLSKLQAYFDRLFNLFIDDFT